MADNGGAVVDVDPLASLASRLEKEVAERLERPRKGCLSLKTIYKTGSTDE